MSRFLLTCCTVLMLVWNNGLLADTIDAQLLVYQVKEPASEPYISRVLVTNNHLRLDRGPNDTGFILLDRKAGVIYNINHDDRLILEINPKKNQSRIPPDMLQHDARRLEVNDSPKVGGKKPEHWEYWVNDQLCRSAVLVPQLMPAATRAYADYLDLLGYQQQAGVNEIPAALQDPCDLTIHVYYPRAVLDRGLPLREWHESGYQTELLDFRQVFPIERDRFQIPDAYRRVTLGKAN